MFGGQDDQIVGPAKPVRGGELRFDGKIAERARYLEPVLGEQRCPRGAHQEGDVAPSLGQPSAKIAADRAGAEHQEAHH
jgi:hypothetical protein